MTNAGRSAARPVGLLCAAAVLVLIAMLSIAVGSRTIPLDTVWHALWHAGGSTDAVVIRELRVPRTLLGLGVGAALGAAGALMQAVTRNPLADPGILGVNAGAAVAVVVAMGVFGVTAPQEYVWFAFVGAACASVVVYVLGSSGPSGATPVRLALAGTAIAAALTSFTYAVTLLDPATFDQFRFWVVGALAGRGSTVLAQVAVFLLAGMVLALLLARPLNALGLGDEAGRAVGATIGHTRALGALAITLLCGAATAAAGPIGFVGLTVPHIARSITGPDQRWVLPYSLVLGATLLLASDVLGRVVTRPGELQAGVVMAFVGAPVFIALVRRRRIPQL